MESFICGYRRPSAIPPWSPGHRDHAQLDGAARDRVLNTSKGDASMGYQDLVGGRLQFMYAGLASVLPFMLTGGVDAIALDRGTAPLPGVPTFAESGESIRRSHLTAEP